MTAAWRATGEISDAALGPWRHLRRAIADRLIADLIEANTYLNERNPTAAIS